MGQTHTGEVPSSFALPSANEPLGLAATVAHCSPPKPSPQILSPSFPRGRPQCQRGMVLSSQPCRGTGCLLHTPAGKGVGGHHAGVLGGYQGQELGGARQSGDVPVTKHLAHSGLLCSLPFVAFSKIHL